MDIETLSCHVTYGAVNTFEGLQLELDLIVIHATVNYPNPTSVINAAVVVFNKLATQAIFSARTTTRHPLAMSSASTQPRPVSNTLLFDTLSKFIYCWNKSIFDKYLVSSFKTHILCTLLPNL